jgi:hypothetical protein
MLAASSRLGACECLKQAVEKNGLAFQNFRMRLVDAKPSGAVKFRELLTPTGSWRPFQLEHTALKIGGPPVAFDGPYVNNLSSRLLCLAERPRFAARPVTRPLPRTPALRRRAATLLQQSGLLESTTMQDPCYARKDRRDDRAELRCRRRNAGKAKDLHSVCRIWPVSPTS